MTRKTVSLKNRINFRLKMQSFSSQKPKPLLQKDEITEKTVINYHFHHILILGSHHVFVRYTPLTRETLKNQTTEYKQTKIYKEIKAKSYEALFL